MNRLHGILEQALGGFLLPKNFGGHDHVWVVLDFGYCVCRECGAEHSCCGHGRHCPKLLNDEQEEVCVVTGVVTGRRDLKMEWGAYERVNFSGGGSGGGGRPGPAISDLVDHSMQVVRELLYSKKSHRCFEMECQRNLNKAVGILGRCLKEAAHDPRLIRPNMVSILSHVHWQCRKHRRSRKQGEDALLLRFCAESIAQLLCTRGWHRVKRILCHHSRRRELICSLLYLMRAGMTFREETILPQVAALEALLPQQIFLQSVFGIRSKSITEGNHNKPLPAAFLLRC